MKTESQNDTDNFLNNINITLLQTASAVVSNLNSSERKKKLSFIIG